MTLTLERVRVTAGKKALIRDLSATIPAAAITAVLGRNGAGKSSLLRALAGVAPLANGRVLLADAGSGTGVLDLATLGPLDRARHAAWVPAHTPVPFDFKVIDLVVLGRFARHQGRPQRTDVLAAEAALATVGAAALAHRIVTSLSSGEQARAAIARGLAAETPIILLDEPTANLDVAAALTLMQTLAVLAAAGRTIVLSLHDLTAAWRFADHALCLDEGALLAAGAPKAVLSPEVLARAFHVKAAPAKTPDGRETLVFDV